MASRTGQKLTTRQILFSILKSYRKQTMKLRNTFKE